MKHLSRFLVLLACTALVIIAEDFWVKKPYTDWSEKDAAKLLQNSPWAHEVSISIGQSSGPSSGGSRGGRRGGGGGASGADMGGPTMSGPAGGGEAGGGAPMGGGMGEPGGGGRGGRAQGDMGGGAVPTIMVNVRWQSALPVRQATVLAQLGRERLDSDQAKKFLAQELPSYVVGIVGLPGNMSQVPPDKLSEMAKNSVSLVRKDKDPIAAESATPSPRERAIYFMFPKTSPITLDDKEVEFVAKVGTIEVKRKFKLKDMVIGDKLEL